MYKNLTLLIDKNDINTFKLKLNDLNKYDISYENDALLLKCLKELKDEYIDLILEKKEEEFIYINFNELINDLLINDNLELIKIIYEKINKINYIDFNDILFKYLIDQLDLNYDLYDLWKIFYRLLNLKKKEKALFIFNNYISLYKYYKNSNGKIEYIYNFMNEIHEILINYTIEEIKELFDKIFIDKKDNYIDIFNSLYS